MDNRVIDYKKMLDFYSGKRVLITGNTGFKGSWLTRILLLVDAEVIGYSLKPPTEPNLFTLAGLDNHRQIQQHYADVRDLEKLRAVFEETRPEIVLHLAAQPIVRDSYRDPVTTYTTNVVGTLNILECARTVPGVQSFLNVTTDKVYKNNEWEYGYREEDPLDGFDPYSNSKSCSELITHSYKNSFFQDNSVRISTVRAGNVIGGGDFANDRIIPDSVRAMKYALDEGKEQGEIIVRNPYSTRPYQHVLEPLFMYLTIAVKQYEDYSYAGYYNVGPDDVDCVTTGDLVSLFCEKWNDNHMQFPQASWKNVAEKDAPHEASFLKLDCSRVKNVFGWRPCWHIDTAIEKTVEFSKIWMSGGDIVSEMDHEIEQYIGESYVKHCK